jgi:GNAT superfamily N-acetyltransferase
MIPRMENVEIVARDLRPEEKRELYESVGWGHLYSDPEQDPMLFTAVALHGGRAVGAASMSGNGTNCFVLRDVMVRPEYQGSGLGGKVLQRVLDWAKEEIPKGRSIILLAPEGREGFYERYGFIGPNHGVVGMRLRT